MSIIYKYELTPGTTKIEFPRFAKVLTAASQGHRVFVWANVYPDEATTEFYEFDTVPTGVEMSDFPGEYLSTVHMPEDGLVFHVFFRKL